MNIHIKIRVLSGMRVEAACRYSSGEAACLGMCLVSLNP